MTSSFRALLFCSALVGLLISSPVWAQQDSDEDQSDELILDEIPASDDDEGGTESQFRGTNQEDLDLIQDLLEEGDESIDTGFVYDPGGRRDPFRSLARSADEVEPRLGPRPEGIPGLLIDNLTVTGIWMWPDGPVAQVRSVDAPISYLLSPGVRVYDGQVVSISWDREEGGKVVFRQVDNDPGSRKPFKEVTRRIQQ